MFRLHLPWGSLFVAICGAILTWHLARFLRREHPSRRWPHTAGLIRDVRVDGSDRDGYVVRWGYSYHVSGEAYLGIAAVSTERPYRERAFAEAQAADVRAKQTLAVYFDPRDPSVSRTETADTGPIWVGLVLAGGAVVGSLYLIYQWSL